jgi:16S rRNA (uracil1498-N3)-methyltransferase
MKRLYVTPDRLRQGPLGLGGQDFHYLGRVLRVAAGDELVLFDGLGHEAPARVTSVGEAIDLDVGEPTLAPVVPPIELVLALLKGEKMDLVVQKATELGVARILPVAAARSVVRLDDDRAETRLQRWKKIAREAARLCGRADVPEIAAPSELAPALSALPHDAWKVIFHEDASAPLRSLLPVEHPEAAVAAVGPEGGFTEQEIAIAVHAGFAVAGLGPRVLRGETAALTAVTLLSHLVGDLG